jgi:hypothetical protein
VVPWEKRGATELSFPAGTTDFFRDLSRSLDDTNVTLAVDREQYLELALHGSERRWPSIFVSTVFLGALGNVLATEVENSLMRLLLLSPSR